MLHLTLGSSSQTDGGRQRLLDTIPIERDTGPDGSPCANGYKWRHIWAAAAQSLTDDAIKLDSARLIRARIS